MAALGQHMSITRFIFGLRRKFTFVQIALIPVAIVGTLGFYGAATSGERLLLELGHSPDYAHFLGFFVCGPIGGLLSAAVLAWVLRHILVRLQRWDDLLEKFDE